MEPHAQINCLRAVKKAQGGQLLLITSPHNTAAKHYVWCKIIHKYETRVTLSVGTLVLGG